jgi:hypothetical protein
MMELNDNEFDAAFKRRVSDAEPEYEELAWNKMEQKLKRRDRIIFARKAGAVSVFLLAILIGLYTARREQPNAPNTISANSVKQGVPQQRDSAPLVQTEVVSKTAKLGSASGQRNMAIVVNIDRNERKTVPESPAMDTTKDSARDTIATGIEAVASNMVATTESNDDDSAPEVKKRLKKAIPLSLSISAGPEFNSASSVIGGDPGFSAGLALGIGITKRLSLQAGLQYSQKVYHANNYAYNLNNPQIQSIITEIDATCAVLEIPLLVSYKLSDNYKSSINLNGGISSYLMLKEDYNFKYTPQSGFADRQTQIVNENRHYLSVVDLSATYFLKLKKNHLQVGFEPFVKIPLSGVGEGRIKLKSSGIALRLRYDIN